MFASTALALCMAWSGDKKIAGWGCAVFAASYVPMLYAGSRIQRLMDPDQRRFTVNARAIAFVILYIATVTGLFVTFSGAKDPLSTALGSSALWGGLSGAAATLIYGWWKTKQADKNRPDPAQIPDED